MILSIETATSVCSVSLLGKNGEITEKRTDLKGSHSEKLFLFIKELLADQNAKVSEIEKLLVSSGPGSYTGLRIAASAVKGLLFGRENIELYRARTLAGFAYGVASEHPGDLIHAVINARRNHLYHQPFNLKNEVFESQSEAGVKTLDDINNFLQKSSVLIGTGIDRLNYEKLSEITTYGLEKISARNLIKMFQDGHKGFFESTTSEELESDYISTGQVNNSSR